MTMHGAVRDATPDDLPQLFDLFRQAYPSNPRMLETDYFTWQFARAPGTERHGERTFMVQEGADGICGCFGFVPVEFRHPGGLDWGAWTQNWYSTIGGGGGMALLNEFFRRVDNRFLLRLSTISEAICRVYRMPILPRLPRWWAAVDAAAVIGQFGFDRPEDRLLIEQSASRLARSLDGPPLTRIKRFDSGAEWRPDMIWPQISSYCRRSADYLNWRYLDAPRHDYRAFVEGEQLAVYRAEQITGSDYSVLRLLEWTFAPADSGRALAGILADAAPSRPILIDFHCTVTSIGDALGAFGFVAQDQSVAPMPDLFRPTYHSGGYQVAIDLPPHRTARDIDFAGWYMTAGESDIDRVKL